MPVPSRSAPSARATPVAAPLARSARAKSTDGAPVATATGVGRGLIVAAAAEGSVRVSVGRSAGVEGEHAAPPMSAASAKAVPRDRAVIAAQPSAAVTVSGGDAGSTSRALLVDGARGGAPPRRGPARRRQPPQLRGGPAARGPAWPPPP